MRNRLIKHGIAIIGIAALAFMAIASASTPSSSASTPARTPAPASSVTQNSQTERGGPVTPQTPPPPFTGDGGKGKSITILPPRGVGLTKDQAYLPDLVANELVSNFRSFSAMTLFDRVNYQKQYDELLSGIYADDDKAGWGIAHEASTDYMLLGDITRTSTGYALHLTVNRNSDKTTAAMSSGTVSITDLDNLTGVRQASLKLLEQMEVNLTPQARTELTRAATADRVNGQTALAQGITAQRRGTEVAAFETLFYYEQAVAFDPSLIEAGNRASIVSANISSGNIGENIRNDIAWRDAWEARLKETEQFFNRYFDDFFKKVPAPSYTLFYSGDIAQIGQTNYQDRTATLGSIKTNLHISSDWIQSIEPVFRSMQTSIQTVYDGLNATGRKDVWGFGRWPQQGGSFNVQPFRRQSSNFTVVIELLNSQGKVIGRQTVQTTGTYQFPVPLPGSGSPDISVSDDDRKTVDFTAVKADEITDNLTIRIASVNGAAAETAARNGVLQIRNLSRNDFETYSRFTIVKGEIRSYNGDGGHVVIPPAAIWDEPVVSIGNGAFRNRGLTGVTIPASVTSIGNSAFANNQLRSVTIPSSVRRIGENAFSGNQLTSVTIGALVTLGNSAIGSGFETAYNNGGKPAGAYVSDSSCWGMRSGVYLYIGSTITRYTGSGGSGDTIPATINGTPVTAIGANAFSNKQLRSVTIPASVRSIGENAFSGNQLIKITIGANVNLGKNSFANGFIEAYNSGFFPMWAAKSAGEWAPSDSNSTGWFCSPWKRP